MNSIAPSHYQESYDNAGLICGSFDWEIEGVVCCLDSTEKVIEEAIEKSCNLVVAHHPIIFKGLKQIHDDFYVHRVIRKAIKNDIAIYAAHTNLDNVLQNGVNQRIAERLKLENCKILSPKSENLKAAVYTSELRVDNLENILSQHCNTWEKWEVKGKEKVDYRYEIILPSGKYRDLSSLLRSQKFHHETVQDSKTSPTVGSGIIGNLNMPMSEKQFLDNLRKTMQTEVVRHTDLLSKSISKVAICGGAGSFLLDHAKSKGADIFITGDFKYHEFFDADGDIIIADIGHYESEQFTIQLLRDIITENFTTFAVHCTEVHTNPVNYYYG